MHAVRIAGRRSLAYRHPKDPDQSRHQQKNTSRPQPDFHTVTANPNQPRSTNSWALLLLCCASFQRQPAPHGKGEEAKEGEGGPGMFVPPSFSSIPTCRRRGAGIARHAARGSGSGSGSGNIPPMYNVCTRSMCLAWVGLDWAGWDHTTTTTTTPTNCEARNESFLVIPGG